MMIPTISLCTACWNAGSPSAKTCSHCGAVILTREGQIKFLESEGAKHDARAETMLGSAFLIGDGVPQDLDAAKYWLLRAAQQNHTMAYFHLAVLHDEFLEDTSHNSYNKRQAVFWYEKMHSCGTREIVSIKLGDAYLYGIGVEQDKIKATEFYRQSQYLENREVKYKLAMALNRAETYIEGNYWMQIAAEEGFSDAQYRIGMIRIVARNEFQNLAIGIDWLGTAAAHGHAKAMETLINFSNADDNDELATLARQMLRQLPTQ